jgi:prepilin-type N-terminal cleavage/methylation domain-containing protein
MKNRKGFTLIELMIVVAIISLLAAMIVPMFTGRKTMITSSQNLNQGIEYTTEQRLTDLETIVENLKAHHGE